MCFVERNLWHIFRGIRCAVRWLWCSCILNLGMWYVMGTCLLRIKSRDVTPWGLVDRPKQFGGTCYLPLQGMSSFPVTLKMEMPGSTKLLVAMCQTPPHHILWTQNRNTFYTENTNFTCILLAFRVAQHDSSSWNRSIVKLCHSRKLTFL